MQYEISGFWRRLGAFFIDSIILSAFGFILGLVFTPYLVELGGWGRVLGFFIAITYFAILNSSIGGGQTIGKRLLKIQVLDKDGELLNFTKSAIRYSIIGIPFFLNGALIPESFFHTIVFYLLSVLVFGFSSSIVYLIVFNRNTRQSLHDIIVGSFVIMKGVKSSKPCKSIWSVHYVICAIIMVLALLAPILIGHLSKKDFFSQLITTREQIQDIPEVAFATIQDGQSIFKPLDGESTKTTYIASKIYIKSLNIEDEQLATKIAKAILKTHKEAIQKNLITVTLIYGYDIGISSRCWGNTYAFTPDEWLAK